MPRKALLTGVLTLGVSRGVVTRRSIRLAMPCHALTHPVDKAAKRGDWMGACFLSRFPWLSGQVGTRQDALNALVPVPARQAMGGVPALRPADSYEPVSAFDGHRSVEPQLIRTTLFPCSRPWSLSCFDDHVCDRGGVESGASIYTRVLLSCPPVRVPLTDTLDSS